MAVVAVHDECSGGGSEKVHHLQLHKNAQTDMQQMCACQ
jgi:hypothetical protein